MTDNRASLIEAALIDPSATVTATCEGCDFRRCTFPSTPILERVTACEEAVAHRLEKPAPGSRHNVYIMIYVGDGL